MLTSQLTASVRQLCDLSHLQQIRFLCGNWAEPPEPWPSILGPDPSDKRTRRIRMQKCTRVEWRGRTCFLVCRLSRAGGTEASFYLHCSEKMLQGKKLEPVCDHGSAAVSGPAVRGQRGSSYRTTALHLLPVADRFFKQLIQQKLKFSLIISSRNAKLLCAKTKLVQF